MKHLRELAEYEPIKDLEEAGNALRAAAVANPDDLTKLSNLYKRFRKESNVVLTGGSETAKNLAWGFINKVGMTLSSNPSILKSVTGE
jgi:hypothetical protein